MKESHSDVPKGVMACSEGLSIYWCSASWCSICMVWCCTGMLCWAFMLMSCGVMASYPCWRTGLASERVSLTSSVSLLPPLNMARRFLVTRPMTILGGAPLPRSESRALESMPWPTKGVLGSE